jgi:3-oxoadipate enol-lactonase
MKSGFVNVGSARVAYRVLGMGPAVLLVNGTGGGDGHWGDLIERLARSGPVVTLDYSGVGDTTDDGAPLDLPTLARQVAAVAEAVGAVHVDLVSHSLGAAVATVLAAERPELVRTLTLVAGCLTTDEPRLKLTFELWRRLLFEDMKSGEVVANALLPAMRRGGGAKVSQRGWLNRKGELHHANSSSDAFASFGEPAVDRRG